MQRHSERICAEAWRGNVCREEARRAESRKSTRRDAWGRDLTWISRISKWFLAEVVFYESGRVEDESSRTRQGPN